MSEKKFVTGCFVSRRDSAPDFVKANLSFNEKFIEYLKENFNSKGYVNIDLKESKEGKLYLDLNDWQPTGDQEKLVKEGIEIKVEPRDNMMDALSNVNF